ncbi:MAG: ATP-binding protein, partial [Actinobacteria bacterium]|nr:ATP-binding protein [Actinomycetota bacterium]
MATQRPALPGGLLRAGPVRSPSETMVAGSPGGEEQMGAVMVERDAVMAAVRALTADALAGRGGALFVAGEAGLGKTTVLEYAVATAAGRFAVGTG